MGFLTEWKDKFMGSVVKKSVEKAIKKVVSLVVSFLAAKQLGKYGIKIDETQLTAAVFGFVEVARDYVKHKFNISWL